VKKIIIFILGIIILCTIPLYAQNFDYSKSYLFKMPSIELKGKDYEGKIEQYKVSLTEIDNSTFTIIPVVEYGEWVKSISDPRVRGWVGKIGDNNGVKISGLIIGEYSYAILELTGKLLSKDMMKGTGNIRIGFGHPGETPYVSRSEWCLEPEDTAKPLKISKKVTYHGPPLPPPEKMSTYSPEEKAKFPPIDEYGIKSMARRESDFRERLINKASGKRKMYYKNISTELTWEEIKYTPGILLLIDHLATLAEADQRPIAKGYIDDKSWDFFGDIPYVELQKVPPLFLILRCLDKMKETDIEGLKKESLRFKEMFDAYNTIPKEKLSTLTLEEFILKVSENLPEDFRKDYYHHSPKLQNYVTSSDDANLKKLYPFRK